MAADQIAWRRRRRWRIEAFSRGSWREKRKCSSFFSPFRVLYYGQEEGCRIRVLRRDEEIIGLPGVHRDFVFWCGPPRTRLNECWPIIEWKNDQDVNLIPRTAVSLYGRGMHGLCVHWTRLDLKFGPANNYDGLGLSGEKFKKWSKARPNPTWLCSIG